MKIRESLCGWLSRRARTSKDAVDCAVAPVVELLEQRTLLTAMVANFTDGNGSGLVDQYPGVAGNGWAGPWAAVASSAASVSASVVPDTPLHGGGKYLAATVTATGAAGTGSVNRAYTSTGTSGADLGTDWIHKISFDFRLDSDLSTFTSTSDQINLFGDSTSKNGTGPNNTWDISAFGAPFFGAQARTWAFQKGDLAGGVVGMVDTGVSLVRGTVYHFTIVVDPAVQTYVASVSDGLQGAGHSFTSGSLNWRAQLPFTHSTAGYVGMAAVGSAAGEQIGYSADSVSVVPVAAANFSGGSGPDQPDKYAGTAGSGWSGGWATAGTGASLAALVTNGSQVGGAGNYLSATVTSSAAAGTASVNRGYVSTGDVSTGGIHRISFDFRLDSSLATFTQPSDQINLFGDGTSRSGTGPSNTWALSAIGTSTGNPRWAFQNGNQANGITGTVDTGVTLSPLTLYHFTIVVDPANRSYTATVSDGHDGPGHSVSSGTLGFRTIVTPTGSSTAYLGFAAVGSAANESVSFSVDSVAVTGAPPAAAASLVASPFSDARIDLSWAAAPGSPTSYVVERSSDNANWSALPQRLDNPTATTYSDTALPEGARYYYRVRAVNFGDLSAATPVATAMTKLTPPDQLRVQSVASGRVDLQWTNHSALAAGYEVERSTDGTNFTLLASLPAAQNTYSDTSVASQATYWYRVRASGTGGTSSSSYAGPVTATVPLPGAPAAPTGLTATPLSASDVGLAWTDNSGNEDHFIIEVSSDGLSWSTLTTTGPDVVTYTTSGLPAGATRTFRVRATNAGGESGAVGTASATTFPAAPPSLVATTVSAARVDLSWHDVAGEDGYAVEKSTDGGASWTEVGRAGRDAVSWSVTQLDPGTAYQFRVRAFNTGSSPYSAVASATTVPVAPSGLVAAVVSAARVDLSWADVSGETGYVVERSEDGGATWADLATVGANTTGYAASGLVAGTAYQFRVRAHNAGGDSARSNVASGTTTPAAPAGLAATAVSSSQIELSWTDVVGETGYRVARSDDGGATFAPLADLPAGATGYSATGLAPATAYQFSVVAYNASGDSVAAHATGSTAGEPPASPTNLGASVLSNTQVALTWADDSDHESGFRVERSTDGANWTPAATAGAEATGVTVSGLAPGTAYHFRVRAFNTLDGNPSAEVVATTTAALPAAPTALSATTLDGGSVQLSWSGGDQNTDGFTVDVSIDDIDYSALGSVAGAGTTTFTAAGLNASTQYYFRVRAQNTVGSSAASNMAEATTDAGGPPAPVGLTAVVASATKVDLSWVDTSDGEAKFYVEQSTDGATFVTGHVVDEGIHEYSVDQLSPGTDYWFRVRASGTAGSLAYTQPVQARTAAMTAPTDLSAVAVSGSEVDLTWSDASYGEGGFEIDRSTDGVNFESVGTTSSNVTSFQVLNLTPGTTYWFRVQALSLAGNSIPSGPAQTMTLPVAPLSLTATPVSTSQIDLSWQDVSGETAYRIERSPDGIAWTQVGSTPAGVTAYSDLGLAEGTYQYRVRAANAAGAGDPSVEMVTGTRLSAPTGLTAVVDASNAIQLTWTDASGEDGFFVERSIGGGAFTVVGQVGAGVTRFSAGPAAPSTSYTFRVAGQNPVGLSPYATALLQTDTSVPAPTGLSAMPASPQQVDLSWAGGGTSAGIDEFQIERSTDGLGFVTVGTVAAGASTFSDAGLSPSTDYYYRVGAVGRGEVIYSTTIAAHTPAAPVPAPTGLQAVPAGAGRVHLAWVAPPGVDGTTLIEYSPDGTAWTGVGAVPSTQENFVVSLDLPTGEPYQYRVRLDAGALGTSDPSVSVQATAEDLQPGATGVMVTHVTIDQIALSWVDAADLESGFKVQKQDQGQWVDIATVPAGTTTYVAGNLAADTAYMFRVVTLGAPGAADSDPVTGRTLPKPPTPTNLVATAISSGQVDLTWQDGSSGANGFRVERSDDEGAHYYRLAILPAGVTSYSVIGLAGGPYKFRVAGISAQGDLSEFTAEVRIVTPPRGAADFPRVDSVEGPGALQVTVDGTDVQGADDFELEMRTEGESTWTKVGTTANPSAAVTVSGLLPLAKYFFRSRARNAAGYGPYSPQSQTPYQVPPPKPAAPSNFRAEWAPGNRVHFTWDDNSDNENYFRIEQSVAGGSWEAIPDGGAPLNDATHHFQAPSGEAWSYPEKPNADYAFRLAAINDGGQSVWVNAPLGLRVEKAWKYPPAAPNVTSSVSFASGARLEFMDNSYAETGFSAEISTDGVTWRDADGRSEWRTGPGYETRSGAGLRWMFLDNLTPNTTYFVRLTAFTGSEYGGRASAPSPVYMFKTLPPELPTDGPKLQLTATRSGDTQADLTWTPSANATQYYVYREELVDGWWTFAATPLVKLPAGTTRYAVSGLDPKQSYRFWVEAKAITNGEELTVGGRSDDLAVYPVNTPTEVTASVTGSDSVSLSWKDDSANEIAFQILQSTDGQTFTPVKVVPANVTSTAMTGLTNGGTYIYRVRGINAGGGLGGEDNTVRARLVSQRGGALRTDTKFFAHALPWQVDEYNHPDSITRESDDAFAAVPLGFTIDFQGETFSSVFVNENGAVTLGAPLGDRLAGANPYVTEDQARGMAALAPFLSDVDRSMHTSGEVYYGAGNVDGHKALVVTWVAVGAGGDSPPNTYQVVIIDRSDRAPKDFDVEFNYDQLSWDLGYNDLGEEAFARAFISNGAGAFQQLPGSGSSGVMLDAAAASGLIYGMLNSNVPGRYRFQVGGELNITVDSNNDGVIDGADDSIEDDADKPGHRMIADGETKDSINITLASSVDVGAAQLMFILPTPDLLLEFALSDGSTEVIASGTHYSAASLGFSSSQRTVVAHLVAMSPSPSASPYRIQALLDRDGSGRFGSENAVRVTATWFPVSVGNLYSAQYGTIPANYMPGGQGHNDARHQYLLVAPDLLVGPSVLLDAEVSVHSGTEAISAVLARVILAHRLENGQIVLDGKEVISAGGRTFLRWKISDTENSSVVLKHPVIIYDQNGNGYDPAAPDAADLVMEFANFAFRTVWRDEYVNDINILHTLASAAASGMSAPAVTLEEDMRLSAGTLLEAFLSGSMSYGSDGGSSVSVTPADLAGELTHRVGLNWTGSPSPLYEGGVTATAKRYTFFPTSILAQEIDRSPELLNKINAALRSCTADALLYFAQTGAPSVTLTLPLSDGISFIEHNGWNTVQSDGRTYVYSEKDLYYAIHNAAFAGTLTVTILNDPTLTIESLNVNGMVDDVYDFDYSDMKLPRLAATVQTGFGAIGTAGGVYLVRVNLNEDLAAVGAPYAGNSLLYL